MSKLLGKVIIVTGGAGLIGNSIIERLKKEGGIIINAEISLDTNYVENIFTGSAPGYQATAKITMT